MPTAARATEPDAPRFYGTKEVARLLRITERTVYELVRERQIPTVRVAGKWLFPRDLLERWLDENTDASSLASRADAPPPVLAGSHDPLLEWAVRESGCGLAMLCDGSEDGVARVAARRATLAAVHLMDADGGWNREAFDALPNRGAFVLVEWARRRQGWVVAPGNPLAVGTVADAAARGLRIAVRQPGSGSRRLLERLAARDGVAPDAWLARSEVARSESAVAEAIVAGRADTGLAVEAVARQHRLDFVPLHDERVDLLLRRFDWFEPPMQALLAFCRGDAFRARAAQWPGYDASGLGRVVANG